MEKKLIQNEKGIALLMALIACLILLAVGMLVMNMSTGDLIASSLSMGNRKALIATESGVNRFLQDFDPTTSTMASASYSPLYDGGGHLCGNVDYATSSYVYNTTPGGNDDGSQFAICTPHTTRAPLPAWGYDPTKWAYYRYDTTVVGKNTSYGSTYTVDVGIGFGPVPMMNND